MYKRQIFKIVKSDQPRAKGISAKYFEDSQIIITLSKELFDQMQLIESANLKLTAIVLPVLVDAIDFIRANEGQGEDEDVMDRQWCRTIKRLMEANGLNDDLRPLEIAQKLLANPIDGYATEVAAQQENEEVQA